MRILSVDQALNKTGYSVFFDDMLHMSGVFNISDIKNQPIELQNDEKISNVKMFLERVVQKYGIDLVVIENVQKQTNVSTFKTLAHLQGVLKNWCYENNIAYSILSPSEWRSTIGIKGRTREVQKLNAKKYILDKYEIEASEDQADSLCLGLAAIKLLNKNKLKIIKDI